MLSYCNCFPFSGFDLKDCSKFFASKFSCGTSVNDDLDIVVQGDVKDVLFSIIPGKWPQVGVHVDFVQYCGIMKLLRHCEIWCSIDECNTSMWCDVTHRGEQYAISAVTKMR